MANKLKYLTLDVFTNTPYKGNPLAVIHVPAATRLTQRQKQLIAFEFNYSETVFVHESTANQNEWTINIFTTTEELPLAGHPVIGTACHLLTSQSTHSNEAVNGTLVTKAGRIAIRAAHTDMLPQIYAAIPHNVHIHSDTLTVDALTQLHPELKPLRQDLAADASPVVSIVKGMTFALLEFKTLEALNTVTPAPQTPQVKLDAEWDDSLVGLQCYYIKNATDTSFTIDCRMFLGPLEDAATGSAASALSSYLSLKAAKTSAARHFKFALTQGEKMGRTSQIGVEVSVTADASRIDSVTLSGTATQIMSGEVLVPPE